MATPLVLALLVNVIEGAASRACARANECALSAPDQSAGSGANGRAYADAFGRFFLPRFGIASTLRVHIRTRHKAQREQASNEKH
jgi:hypothetical protein